MAITANLTVTFGEEKQADNQHLSAEIDSREDGLNDGETNFMPGDTAWFLVYKSDNVAIDKVENSAGTISLGASVSVEKTEDLMFSNTDSATISVPTNALTSSVWLGNSLGTAALQSDQTTIKIASKGVGVLRVTYSATAQPYSIKSPATLAGYDNYAINIVITGKPAASTTITP